MFKIDSEKELLSFLKILSEEAVKKSRRNLGTGDSLAQSFKERLRTEKETLYEQETGEDEEEEGTSASDTGLDDETTTDQAGSEETSDTETPEAETPEAETAGSDQSVEPEKIQASLDALERFINSVRAGKSLRDSTVEDQLELYFDRLGEDEKSLLVLFMREVSRILSGKITGDNAVNPNDEPYNLDVVLASDEQEEPAEQETPGEAPVEDQPAEFQEFADEEEEEGEEEEEDTSPPIQVGQPQDLAEIRKKVKLLMKG